MKNNNNKPKSKVRGVVWKRGAWWLDYRFNGRRRREKVGDSQEIAENAMHKIRTEIAENRFLDIREEKQVKFEEFADRFLEEYCKVHHKCYMESSGSNIKALKRYLSGKYLHEITPQVIEKYKAERLKEVSSSTVNRGLATLKSLFNRAIDWEEYDGLNPVKKVKFLKEPNHRLRFLEKEEIVKLIESSPEHLKPIVIVAVNTGMRLREILNLKWEDIDLKREVLYLYNTKSGKKREIPLNAQVKATLISIQNDKNEYAFCREDGTRVLDIRKPFFTALKRSGIIDFRFHDLRHTAASHLVMAGVDLNTVRELLGHSSLEMNLRYAHLSPNHKKRAVDVLSKHLGTGWSHLELEQDTVKSENSAIDSNTMNYEKSATGSGV